jgi:hypothetical protein
VLTSDYTIACKLICSVCDWLQVLERLSFSGRSVGDALAQEGRILLFWYWMTYALLKMKKPKYQPLELPTIEVQSTAKLEELKD